jgi:singapore isolate B (sub-type 7) whole genome shotgun sequence assembly, scaffold_14
MFVSESKTVSLLLAILTMITWGTNKIAVKYLTYPVSLYTIDFFAWVFIFHTLMSLTLGAGWFGNSSEDTFRNIMDVFHQGVVACCLE